MLQLRCWPTCTVIYPSVQVGPNQYRFEVEWGGNGGLDRQAKDGATKTCVSLGKTVAEVSIEMHSDDMRGRHYATVKFDCH